MAAPNSERCSQAMPKMAARSVKGSTCGGWLVWLAVLGVWLVDVGVTQTPVLSTTPSTDSRPHTHLLERVDEERVGLELVLEAHGLLPQQVRLARREELDDPVEHDQGRGCRAWMRGCAL